MASKNSQTIIVIRNKRAQDYSCLYRTFLNDRGFEVLQAFSISEAVELIEKNNVSLLIVFAYRSKFSDQIDNYLGSVPLPPIAYWYIHNIDELPRLTHVTPVSCFTTVLELVTIATKIIERKLIQAI